MCVNPNRYAKGTGKTKISNLDDSFVVNEQILRFKITVQHPPGVAEQDGRHNLIQVALQQYIKEEPDKQKCWR